MFVQCSLCGGETRREPGQAMLVCSFCGASLALDGRAGVERLILSHTRDDAAAEWALRSHLAEASRRRMTSAAVEFSFIPFSMVEDDEGGISILPAANAWPPDTQTPYPPAGKYEYLAAADIKEAIIVDDSADPRSRRVIHLPVYAISYEALGWRGRAVVIGESWQVLARELPPERFRRSGVREGVAAVALFAGYFAIAKITPGFFGRIAAVAAASAAGYAAFLLRARGKG